MPAKCRAKNPATCRTHGTQKIANIMFHYVYKDDSKWREWAKLNDLSTNRDKFELAIDKTVTMFRDYLEENLVQDNVKGIQFDDLSDGRTLKRQIDMVLRKGGFPFSEYLINELVSQYNKNPPIPQEENYLEKTKEAGHRYLLVRFLVDKGYAAKLSENYYDPRDSEATEHLNRCGVQYATNVLENSWGEFQDSFTEGTAHGITGDVICNCGGVRREMRWEGTINEALQGAFSYFDK